jgi:hypothetical protein
LATTTNMAFELFGLAAASALISTDSWTNLVTTAERLSSRPISAPEAPATCRGPRTRRRSSRTASKGRRSGLTETGGGAWVMAGQPVRVAVIGLGFGAGFTLATDEPGRSMEQR